MADLLSSATSGLLAFQRAIDTTGHNIANVNTEGYSRQRVQIGTRTPEPYSNGWLGSGADVRTVERLYSDLLAAQTRVSASNLSRLDAFAANGETLDHLFGDSQAGLSASLQRFIDSFHDVSASPASIPARQVALSQARIFADRLQSFEQRLSQLDKGIDAELNSEVSTINSIARQIADLNQRIQVGQARTGQPPNDLLDDRDRLIDELATHVNVQVATQDEGSVLISIGNGQSLVVGTSAATLTTVADPYDPTRRGIAIQTSGALVDVTTRLTGGKLGGLLDFRREVLTPARNDLGLLAVATADVVNAQHRSGIDLNGNFGTDLFSLGGVEVQSRNTNTGTAAAVVTRGPTASLTEHDYILASNGGVWSLRRADTGAAVTLAGAGTVGSPFVAEGLSIVVSGAPVSGDSFLIRPTRGAIGGLDLLVTDPNELAAAAPIVTSVNTTNVGNARISAGEVLDATNAALQTPAIIEFLTPTTYSINGGAAQAYTPGANIDFNGWRVQISGVPSVGDEFNIGPNNNPVGDNRNALALGQALARPVLFGGSTTIHAGAGLLVGDVAVATNQARTMQEAQQALHDFNVDAQDTISGVNLDEEAANLVRFQQAYQAAAQVISIADRLFQAVLDATRR